MKLIKPVNSFSLIELIIVIILISILSAIALPKFINVKNDAKTKELENLAGIMKTGVELIRNRWLLQGKPSEMNYNCTNSNEYDVHLNSLGYIDGAQTCSTTLPTAASSHNDCATIFNVVMDKLVAAGAGNISVCLAASNNPAYCTEHYGSTCYMRPNDDFYMTSYFAYNYSNGNFFFDYP